MKTTYSTRLIFILLLLVISPLVAFSALDSNDGSSISRIFEKDKLNQDEEMDVIINIDIDKDFNHNAFLVEEIVPQNIEIVNSGNGDINGQKILFGAILEDKLNPAQLIYRIKSNKIGTYIFGGEYYIDGMDDSATLLGQTQLQVITPPDITNPVISNGLPSGILPAGTTQTLIRVTTDEIATCRFSTTSQNSLNSMTLFSTTNGLTHTQLITGLTDGNSYNYYIKCEDSFQNYDLFNNYVISFAVENAPVAPECTSNDSPLNCPTGSPGICSSGIKTCENNFWSVCKPIHTPSFEICGNDIDEDCDGFVLGSCKPQFHFNDYFDSYTHLSNLNETELLSVPNVQFKKGDIKIEFLTPLRFNKTLNFSSHIRMENKKVQLNSLALPELNKKAKLIFYNLKFNSPLIYKDNMLCPETQCFNISYQQNILSFEVKGFSTYEIRENSTNQEDETSPSSSTKSGSGSGGSSPRKTFSTYKPPELVCEEKYVCNQWSSCENGAQFRICRDENTCLSDIEEKQECGFNTDQHENSLLNAKKISVEEIEPSRRYKADFVGTEELLIFDKSVPEYILLVNAKTGKEYLSYVVDTNSNGDKLYVIKNIDIEIIESGILNEKNLIDVSFSKRISSSFADVYNNQLVMTISTIMLIFVLICCLFASYFIIKNIHRKQAYNAILNKKNQDFLEERFGKERVKEFEAQIIEVKKYINSSENKHKNDEELRTELLNVGWNHSLVDEILEYRHNK